MQVLKEGFLEEALYNLRPKIRMSSMKRKREEWSLQKEVLFTAWVRPSWVNTRCLEDTM